MEQLTNKLLSENYFSIFYGKSNIGKTNFMLDLAKYVVLKNKKVLFYTKHTLALSSQEFYFDGNAIIANNLIITDKFQEITDIDLVILDDINFSCSIEQDKILNFYQNKINKIPIIITTSTHSQYLSNATDFINYFKNKNLKIWNRCIRLYKMEEYTHLFSPYLKLTVVYTKNGDWYQQLKFKKNHKLFALA